MSIQINPIFDDGSPIEFDLHGGTPVLNESLALAELADQIGVQALDDFDEYAHVPVPPDFDGSPDDLYAGQTAGWFDPQDGLRSIDALLGAVEKNPDCLESEMLEDVMWSLQQLRAALELALARGTRFHFSVF